ncbi:MAG: 4a-hydroxytetrahydrobiopterin dehydratase [Pseudomonadota bacterium]
MHSLPDRHCTPCEGGIDPLPEQRVERLLPQIPGWSLAADQTAIQRRFEFDNFERVMAFVNAMAWMANRQGHHPDFTVSAYHCEVIYTTHAIGGLSENDFICAARLDALTERRT